MTTVTSARQTLDSRQRDNSAESLHCKLPTKSDEGVGLRLASGRGGKTGGGGGTVQIRPTSASQAGPEYDTV